MALNQTQYPTLADVAKTQDPSGKAVVIVEILNETNEILEDMVWMEANQPTSHKTTIRSGLPSATWRKLYDGVQPSKSTNVSVTDTVGNCESYAVVDKDAADLDGNTAEFRLSEDRAFIESMGQQMTDTIFYGNDSIENAKFTGFSARFNNLLAQNGQNIIDAGGTGSDNTSIWLIGWGKNTAAGIYPRNKKGGLQSEDKGQVTEVKPDGGRFEAYSTHYKWEGGLCIRDWRYVVRIANIDVSNLKAADPNDSAQVAAAIVARKSLIDHMVAATELLQSTSGCRPIFYCNRGIRSAVRQAILDKTSNNLTSETVAGRVVTYFDEIPVRRVDALLNTEARVVGTAE